MDGLFLFFWEKLKNSPFFHNHSYLYCCFLFMRKVENTAFWHHKTLWIVCSCFLFMRKTENIPFLASLSLYKYIYGQCVLVSYLWEKQKTPGFGIIWLYGKFVLVFCLWEKQQTPGFGSIAHLTDPNDQIIFMEISRTKKAFTL